MDARVRKMDTRVRPAYDAKNMTLAPFSAEARSAVSKDEATLPDMRLRSGVEELRSTKTIKAGKWPNFSNS